MRFVLQKKQYENVYKYPTKDMQVASEFADKLHKEMGDFLISVVIFGSGARKTSTKGSDIDVLIICDDTSYVLTKALMETYRVILEKVVAEVSDKLHITSMTFSSFWEYARVGDPVAINILRDGVSLLDKGTFEVLQQLLKQGRVRPSEESVWRYFGRAPKTLTNSNWHILQATLDLYWAVIDSAHAALMKHGMIPPSPDHVADMLYEKFVKRKVLERKYVKIMRNFYRLSKQITHREVDKVSGREFDAYYKLADEFVTRMKKLIVK